MTKQPHELSLLEQELCKETAKVKWSEIESFFANGSLVTVDNSLDLIQVAVAISENDSDQFKTWMSAELVLNTTDDMAIKWQQSDLSLWVVVVKPWVLVQEINS
jgi:hypothetical protein|tara:strand:+ start:118 stop:429 length:312 start_codon:yes stop_codon:yes gene_type:complete